MCEAIPLDEKPTRLQGKNTAPFIISAHLRVKNPYTLLDVDFESAEQSPEEFPLVVESYFQNSSKIINNIYPKITLMENLLTSIAPFWKTEIELLKEHFIKEPLMSSRHGDFIHKNPYEITVKDVIDELTLETLFIPQKDENKNRKNLRKQRLIRFFESQGYDGFKYTNNFEDSGHGSYIVFRPDQVERLDLCQLEKTRTHLYGLRVNKEPPKKMESNNKRLIQICEKYLENRPSNPLSAAEKKDLFHYHLRQSHMAKTR